jgi:integrase
MAHIEKMGREKYKAVIEIGGSATNRKRKTKIFKEKKDAELWMANMITEKYNGTYIEPSSMTFSTWLDKWLKIIKSNEEDTTYDRDKYTIEGHIKPALGSIQLNKINSNHIEAYFENKRKNGRHDGKPGGLSSNTLRKHYIILNKAFKKAITKKLLRYNPMQEIETPKVEKKKAVAMEQKEINKILTLLKEDKFMFTFVMMDSLTGMRRGELLGLEWSDVNLEMGIIKVKKSLVTIKGGSKHKNKTKNSSSKREIKISDNLCKLLKQYKKEQDEFKDYFGKEYNKEKDFIFCKENGYNYNPNTVYQKFKKYLNKVGLSKYKIHTIRHTFATLNLKNGVNNVVVKEMLGHSTITTTLDTYAHVDLEMQKNALDKLDKIIHI